MNDQANEKTHVLQFRKPIRIRYMVLIGCKDEEPCTTLSRHEHDDSTSYLFSIFADTWTDVDQLRRDKLQRLEERIYSGSLFLQDGEVMDI